MTPTSGAFAFGLFIGWHVYHVNRYRELPARYSDLTSLVAGIGGGAVLTLFKPETELFAWYAAGLVVGYALYLLMLIILISLSDEFTREYLIDGRRKDPQVGFGHPGTGEPRPMAYQRSPGDVSDD